MAKFYYAVPAHYTIGEAFDTLEEAAVAAKASIARFFYPGQLCAGDAESDPTRRDEDGGLASYSRAFVDRRVKDSGGDRMLERIEVILTDAEKDALAAAS